MNIRSLLTIVALLLLTGFAKGQRKGTPSGSLDNIVFNKAEHDPEFPGGMRAYYKFVEKNIKWPEASMEIYGSVFITFIVEKDGKLSDIKVIKGLNAIMDAEALRVIKLSPKWKPAIQNKRLVRTQYVVPVRFQRPE